MDVKTANCPRCGGPVSFEEGREDTFCPHCGTQVFRDISKNKELENKDKANKRKMLLILIGILICVLMIVLYVIVAGEHAILMLELFAMNIVMLGFLAYSVKNDKK